MKTGYGAYAGATVASLRASGCRTALLMPLDVCQFVADAVVADPAYACILRGDQGNDADQYSYDASPELEARRYFDRFLRPSLDRWHGWAAVLGPCENWHRDRSGWRGDFELALCRIVQNERQVAYGWGSIPIGNMEPADIPLFAAVLAEASFTAAHLYLGPGRRSVTEEVDSWYLWRPTRLWLPECKRLGLRFPPLMATEVGTYYSPDRTGLTKDEYARVCVDIVRALEAEYATLGVAFLGGIPFGFGTVGTMDVWRMDGTEPIIAAANPERVTITLPGGIVPVPIPIPPPVTPPTPPAVKLWLAIVPSNQDRNPVLGGGTEMAQMTVFAALLEQEAKAYAPITVKVFAGKPESQDATLYAGLRAQTAAAKVWLATAPDGTYTVALNTHTDSGTFSHVGFYYAGGTGTVSYRIGRRIAGAIAAYFGLNTPIWASDYSDYIFAGTASVAAAVLIEIGSHQWASDINVLKVKGQAIARTMVESVLVELGLPTARIVTPPAPVLNKGELRTFPTWASECLAAGEDFRGAQGLARFKVHLKGIKADPSDPYRYGYPVKG